MSNLAERETVFCPASMCPLFAANGSPWTGTKNAPCPEHDDVDKGGCPWWSMSCQGNGHMRMVDEAEAAGGRAFVIGPAQPHRDDIGPAKSYDCPRAGECSWQKQAELAGAPLCPPREALKRGLDPRVCAY